MVASSRFLCGGKVVALDTLRNGTPPGYSRLYFYCYYFATTTTTTTTTITSNTTTTTRITYYKLS